MSNSVNFTIYSLQELKPPSKTGEAPRPVMWVPAKSVSILTATRPTLEPLGSVLASTGRSDQFFKVEFNYRDAHTRCPHIPKYQRGAIRSQIIPCEVDGLYSVRSSIQAIYLAIMETAHEDLDSESPKHLDALKSRIEASVASKSILSWLIYQIFSRCYNYCRTGRFVTSSALIELAIKRFSLTLILKTKGGGQLEQGPPHTE